MRGEDNLILNLFLFQTNIALEIKGWGGGGITTLEVAPLFNNGMIDFIMEPKGKFWMTNVYSDPKPFPR
jgi:hypothetical protein